MYHTEKGINLRYNTIKLKHNTSTLVELTNIFCHENSGTFGSTTIYLHRLLVRNRYI